jgi:predicted metal-dependent peptidase
MSVSQETRLKKAHIALLRHKDTCLYGGVILMGESTVETDAKRCPTAYTDGYNKRYGSKFMEKLSDLEVTGLVLHENLHVMMKHLPRGRDLWKADDQRLVNIAMDYAVNDIIVDLAKANPTLCKLPEGGLYDPMFKDWSFRKIYDYLKQEQQGGGGRGGDPMDEHDMSKVDEMTPEEREKLSQDITEAMQQSAILAGKMGAKVPRTIGDLLNPQVDWREVLREFVSSTMRGDEDYTWRKFNRRRLADDLYLPSTHSESVGELVIAIDTSGSIGGAEIAEFASELVSICETVTPERVRVLWWDTIVHGEQVFEPGQFSSIKDLLKPQGGGGTRAGCVSQYINENSINADCVVVFTDGYIEPNVEWSISSPTLWMVTRKRTFVPPSGSVVQVTK